MSKTKVTTETRDSPQHTEGYSAFKKGHVDDDCPYDKSTPERMFWLCGFYDARRMSKFAHLFEDEHKKYEECLKNQ